MKQEIDNEQFCSSFNRLFVFYKIVLYICNIKQNMLWT